MKKYPEFTIWSNDPYDVNEEDWIYDYMDDHGLENKEEVDRSELTDWIYDCLSMFFDDECVNLNKKLDNNIIAIADLGLWNGRRVGYKVLDNNIKSCLSSSCDYCKWYVDKLNDFRSTQSHHDGTNEILYRMIKPNISEVQYENFLSKLYNGKATRKDITKYTASIGPELRKIYGWT